MTEPEISRVATFLAVSESVFIQRFTRLTQDRRALALEEKSNGECIFLEGGDCAVQPVKPQQCRDFPNLWNFPGFDEICRAIPHLLGETEYQRRIAEATGRGTERERDDGRAVPVPN